jgi:hypothetical protein
MPTATRRKPVHIQRDEPPNLPPVVVLLDALPPSRRNAILLLLDFLHSLPKEDLAIIAKTVQPHLTDEEVADLCGVTTRTLYNWDRFQSWKPRVADYLETKRQRWYMPPQDDDP